MTASQGKMSHVISWHPGTQHTSALEKGFAGYTSVSCGRLVE